MILASSKTCFECYPQFSMLLKVIAVKLLYRSRSSAGISISVIGMVGEGSGPVGWNFYSALMLERLL